MEETGGGSLTGMDFSITSALIQPIQTAIDSGLDVLVPVGIALMAVMVGISLIPKVIYKFF